MTMMMKGGPQTVCCVTRDNVVLNWYPGVVILMLLDSTYSSLLVLFRLLLKPRSLRLLVPGS